MKKIVGMLLIAALVLQGSLLTVFADDTELQPIYRVDIKNICTLLWVGEKPQFSIELDPSMKGVDVISEKWIDRNGKEVTVSGSNIAVAGGEYNYELKLSAKEGFYFANDLKGVYYQGVELEDYQLEYVIPPDSDNQTMIVKGSFNNILQLDAGKLLAMILSDNYADAIDFIMDTGSPFSKNIFVDSGRTTKISDDKYSYELVLKTAEGFHFSNTLAFLYDEEKYGYTIDYDYSLSDDKHTLTIKGLAEKKQDDPTPAPKELKPGISAIDADRIITNWTSESSPKGTSFSKLKLRSTVQSNNSISLRWEHKAKTYVIYGNECGSDNKLKRIPAIPTGNTIQVSKIGGKKLTKGTYYKFIIVGLNSKGKVVSASKLIHVATKGGTAGNYKSVITNAKNSTVRIKKGKTFTLKPKVVRQNAKLAVNVHSRIAYASGNTSIATISSKGVIKAKKRGTCYVYAYAQNGVYKRIKVVVK